MIGLPSTPLDHRQHNQKKERRIKNGFQPFVRLRSSEGYGRDLSKKGSAAAQVGVHRADREQADRSFRAIKTLRHREPAHESRAKNERLHYLRTKSSTERKRKLATGTRLHSMPGMGSLLGQLSWVEIERDDGALMDFLIEVVSVGAATTARLVAIAPGAPTEVSETKHGPLDKEWGAYPQTTHPIRPVLPAHGFA